mgnify:CR=1 FL=1
MKAILGEKLGMTQVFDDEARAIPVTVIKAGPCRVVQVKTAETDGYGAIQIAYRERAAVVNEPFANRFGIAEGDTLRLELPGGMLEREVVGVFRDATLETVQLTAVQEVRGGVVAGQHAQDTPRLDRVHVHDRVAAAEVVNLPLEGGGRDHGASRGDG